MLPHGRGPHVSVLVIGSIVCTFAAIVLKLADSVRENELVVRVDRRTLDFVLRHRVGWLSQGAREVTFLGNSVVVTIVIVAAATFLLIRRRRLDALFLVLNPMGAAVLVAILKHAIARPRPVLADRLVSATGAAFPSGHAAQSVACYVALAVVAASMLRSPLLRKCAYATAVTIALCVGASRVYLGVHWASDVASGWLLATGWLLTLIALRLVLTTARSRPAP